MLQIGVNSNYISSPQPVKIYNVSTKNHKCKSQFYPTQILRNIILTSLILGQIDNNTLLICILLQRNVGS